MARRRKRERRARTERLIEVGAIAKSATDFEDGDGRAKERTTRLMQFGLLVRTMRSTGVMDNYTNRGDLETAVIRALGHNVRTSDGISWNLYNLVYEALSEGWGGKDGKINNLWADDGSSGYQPPLHKLVSPERRTPQTPSDSLT